jgi:hypothetical protein
MLFYLPSLWASEAAPLQSQRSVILVPLLACAWIFALVASARLWYVARQLPFCSAQALWIEDGESVFASKRLFVVACSEITDVIPGSEKSGPLVHLEAIALLLRDGSTRTFPTGSLQECRETVIQRLSHALDIRRHSDRNNDP